MHPHLSPGRTFPDFALPDHCRTEQRLSALQGDDPMLVVLIRGCCCPRDREQLKDLTRFHGQLIGHCQLVVITTDDWLATNQLRQELGAHYPFLYDEGRRVRDELAIAERSDGEHQPMIPHTVLLAPVLQIRRVWNGYYHWGRPSNCELHDALRDIGAQTAREPARARLYPFGKQPIDATIKDLAALNRYAGR
jgi:peroxiredoxin